MKLVLKKTKTVKIVTTTEVFEVLKDVVLVVYRTNGKIKSGCFYHKEDVSEGKTIVKIAKNAIRYSYYDPAFKEEMKVKTFPEMNWTKFIVPAEKLLEVEKYDESCILNVDFSSHMVYRINKEEPLSQVYYFDHCTNSGPTSSVFDLDKIEKKFKRLKSVIEMERVSVPSYNEDYVGHEELRLKILISQADTNKLWEKSKKDKYPSVAMKYEIFGTCKKGTVDPLKVRQFMLPEEVIKARRGW